MRVFLASLAFSLVTTASFAQTAMEMAGFKQLESKSDYKKFKFQDEDVFVISSKKFSSQSDAEKFCKLHKMTLDTDGSALLFAMSGAAEANKFIKEAVTYKVSVKVEDETSSESGIWFWAGTEDKIVLVRDGGGMSSETITPKEYEQVMKKKPALSAICTAPLKAAVKDASKALSSVHDSKKPSKEIGVHDSSRGLTKEKDSEKGSTPSTKKSGTIAK